MGLYDDDNESTTTGDLVDVGYWQAKFEGERLEAALKSRQPEGYIRTLLPSVINLCNDVLKTYPNHEGIKAYKTKAETVQKKVNPDALEEPVKDGFKYWTQYSYEAGYRHSGIARSAKADGQGVLAKSHAKDAVTQLGRAEGVMDDQAWPDDVKAWVKETKKEMEAIVG